MTLNELRKIAKPLGVKIAADRDDSGWGYWLLKDDGSGQGIWDDDNFCSNLDEVHYKLESYEAEAPARTHFKLTISPSAQLVIEGKLQDRFFGRTDNGNDVYQKIVDASSNGFSFGIEPVEIVASRMDIAELYAEMDWALDGLRDLTVGKRNAARALRKKLRTFMW